MTNLNANKIPPYLNHRLPFDKRVNDLISRMNLEEKISQLFNISLEIEHLRIPYYDWRNECIHGVAFAGKATIFPQAIGLAATWNTKLINKIAIAISDEARAKHHEAVRNHKRKRYYGLTFSAPNINILRDPRWGRGQETYGEDPFLTSRMAVAFIKGLQDNHPKYLKLIAHVKHFAVHSGPEKERHTIDINVSNKDLYETYLPAFKACVQEANVSAVMGAYNRLYGVPCCASSFLLDEILRKSWGFKGYIISDGGAIEDIYKNHHYANDFSEAATFALNAGCDILNPLDIITKIKIKKFHPFLLKAVQDNILKEEIIDKTLKRLFTARFKLGMFDPPKLIPFSKISMSIVNCKKHIELSLQAARESIVLLKNEDNLLPLQNHYKSIAVIGPNADNLDTLLGDYNGQPFNYITPLQGIIKKVNSKIKVVSSLGCELVGSSMDHFADAIDLSEKSDLIIMVLGLTAKIEGEEGFVLGPNKGDRIDLDLPGVQEDLLKEVQKIGKEIVLVLANGGALSINYAKEKIPAILEAWYPGEQGGTAIAEVLFGEVSPSGKLPVTFYQDVSQLPEFNDYSMESRTYRYFKEPVLYPFGYGLSYTTFYYSNLQIKPKIVRSKEDVIIQADVKNSGEYDGFEIIQLYLKKLNSHNRLPIRELKGFKKIFLKKNQKSKIVFKLTYKDYSIINDEGNSILELGEFMVSLGGTQPGYENDENILFGSFELI